jgi:hypothetical protein
MKRRSISWGGTGEDRGAFENSRQSEKTFDVTPSSGPGSSKRKHRLELEHRGNIKRSKSKSGFMEGRSYDSDQDEVLHLKPSPVIHSHILLSFPTNLLPLFLPVIHHLRPIYPLCR